MAFFQQSLKALAKRNPALAARIGQFPLDRLRLVRSKDGGNCVEVAVQFGKWVAATPAENPLECAQIAMRKMQNRLGTGFAPVVIVGLYPGYELQTLFEYSLEREAHYNEPFRRIYVVIDSSPCFAAWLAMADQTPVIERPEVEFHWHEQVDEIASEVEQDLNRSHEFIPISVLPEQKWQTLIKPLSQLFRKRKQQQQQWHAENVQYYQQMDSDTLARLLRSEGTRKPRLLMPVHEKSTVVQYAARDTCASLERAGWDTRLFKIARGATAWHYVRQIHQFRPDVWVSINHLRTEKADHRNVFPAQMPFVSWIQDTNPLINDSEVAQDWNSVAAQEDLQEQRDEHGSAGRDLIIGYTGQLHQFGFDKARLRQFVMAVNVGLFRPCESTAENKIDDALVCDVVFASNRGQSTRWLVENLNYFTLSQYGFSIAHLHEVHDLLWQQYNNGHSVINYEELRNLLAKTDEMAEIFNGKTSDEQSQIIEHLFWHLNDPIYRHQVLYWLIDLGVDLHLHGKYWEQHPDFARYACGELSHGPILAQGYRAAKFALHLNSIEGQHQRFQEIIAAGGIPLARNRSKHKTLIERTGHILRKMTKESSNLVLTNNDKELLSDLIFDVAMRVCKRQPDLTEEQIYGNVDQVLTQEMLGNASWTLPANLQYRFDSKEELKTCLEQPAPLPLPDANAFVKLARDNYGRLFRNILVDFFSNNKV